MKLEIKGTITHSTPIEALGKEGKFFVMQIVISKPAPVNEYGETFGKPQHFPVQIIKNDRNVMPNPAELLNQKVNAICYLNGYEYQSQSTIEGIAYGLRLNLKDRSTNGLKEAIKRIETSRDQYRTDLAEANDKLKVIEAALAAMHKKYTAYGTDSQCLTVKLLCSLMQQDISFINQVNNQPASELLKS